MAYALGVLLFALGILISVCLHEAGHMLTAKAFGMKVTRYFVGFGPTLWSSRRGETEYGVKAIPLGGFVKIVGMTPQDDDVDPKDEARAMWRYPVWKRTVVMSAGSATHFLLAFVALWFTAMFVGLPNPALAQPQPAYVRVAPCVVVANEQRDCRPGDPTAPAKLAGLQDDDKITSLNGVSIATYEDLVREIRKLPPGRAEVGYERDGVSHTATVDLVEVQRAPIDDASGPVRAVAALGVAGSLPPGMPITLTYGPGPALKASVDYSGQLVTATFESLKRFPEKVPRLLAALTGEQRDADTPISVVGASRLGGEAVQNSAWEIFLYLFIGLNFFVGIFNLLPVLPVDGGHIAIAWFERVRSWVYARLGRPDPGRVDYYKLMPITYAVIIILGGFTLLTVAADIINPITLFSR
jgi:membrane-associated protease RseP (regulator of RpoE activity)